MSYPDFNLRHLRAFCETAACGSISGASAAVHLSQPAITQAIAKLERVMGTPLFVRRPGGLYPTEAGALFGARAKRALAHLATGAGRAARLGGRGRRGGGRGFDTLVTAAQLRALTAVAETGNFSWAARLAGVSQPTLHRAARDLERVAGVPFYERTAQGIVLTPAARALDQGARLAQAELRQGVDEVNAWLGHDAAELRIGSLPLARSAVLPRAINALSEARPRVRVRVVDGPYGDLLQGVRHGALDLMIGALRDPPPVPDVEQRPLFRDALAVAARVGHPLDGRRGLTVADLAPWPWVVPAPGIPTRLAFDALFRRAGLPVPERLVESSSLILIRGLLAGTDRLTLISAHQIRGEVERGDLTVLDCALDAPRREIGVTTRRDWRPTATQALLLDLIDAAAAGRGESGA